MPRQHHIVPIDLKKLIADDESSECSGTFRKGSGTLPAPSVPPPLKGCGTEHSNGCYGNPPRNTQTEHSRGIPTVFDGIEYRSRLEAKWAAFFTLLGWRYTYEPFDGDGYIPDFVIHGERPMLVEVKPAVLRRDYQEPIEKVIAGVHNHWMDDVLIVGVNPIAQWEYHGRDYELTAGLLLCRPLGMGEDGNDHTRTTWDFDDALWHTCSKCRNISVHHSSYSYTGVPCGCWDGDHYLGYIDQAEITRYWAAASNEVKWRGSAR